MEELNRTIGAGLSHISWDERRTLCSSLHQNSKLETNLSGKKVSQVVPGEEKLGKFEVSYQEKLMGKFHIRLYMSIH